MSEDEALNILKTMCTDNFCIEQLKTKQAIETILDLYQQGKEKNGILQKELDKKIEALDKAMNNPDYISKDKIKTKIKELENKYEEMGKYSLLRESITYEIKPLKELLEENKNAMDK